MNVIHEFIGAHFNRLMYLQWIQLNLQDSIDGNSTISLLKFRPRIDDIGRTLTCKAANPLMEDRGKLSDNMELKIDCKHLINYLIKSKSHFKQYFNLLIIWP